MNSQANSGTSKTFLRPVKILPEITRRNQIKEIYAPGNENPDMSPHSPRKVSAFQIPLREEVQMMYNMKDGKTPIAKNFVDSKNILLKQ